MNELKCFWALCGGVSNDDFYMKTLASETGIRVLKKLFQPQYSVGYNYYYMPYILTSGTKVHIW